MIRYGISSSSKIKETPSGGKRLCLISSPWLISKVFYLLITWMVWRKKFMFRKKKKPKKKE